MALDSRQPLSEVESWDDWQLVTVLEELAERARMMKEARSGW